MSKKKSKSKKAAKIVGGVFGALAGAGAIAAGAYAYSQRETPLQSLNKHARVNKYMTEVRRYGNPKSLAQWNQQRNEYNRKFTGYGPGQGGDGDLHMFLSQFENRLYKHNQRGVHPDDIIDV